MKCVLGPLDGQYLPLTRDGHYVQCAYIPLMATADFLSKANEPVHMHATVHTYTVRRIEMFGEAVEFLAPSDMNDHEVKRAIVEKVFR